MFVESHLSIADLSIQTGKQLPTTLNTTLWGPSVQHGYGRVQGQQIHLRNTVVIREAFGKFNILCVEGLVYKPATTGPIFEQVMAMSLTDKLRKKNKTGVFKKKKVLCITAKLIEIIQFFLSICISQEFKFELHSI